MKPDHVVEALQSAAEQLGVKVRFENLGPGGLLNGGGLCRLRGEWTIIVDKKAAPTDKASVLIEALATFEVEPLTLPKPVKQQLLLRRQTLLAMAPTAAPAPTA